MAAVAAGGFLGAAARYQLAAALPVHDGRFPLTTLVVNASGSFVLGVILTLLVQRWRPTRYARAFFVTGVIGAYTTWSTFMVEADMLVKSGRLGTAAAYVAASLVAGVAAVYAGMLVVRHWPRIPRRRR